VNLQRFPRNQRERSSQGRRLRAWAARGAKGACCAVMLTASFLAVSWSSAQADILSRLKKGEKLQIAAIGTSLTAASFNAENWFAQWGAWLSSQYPGQVTLSNRAVSGTCSCNLPQFDRPHGGFWQLEQVLANDAPDVVFIEFATNDAGRLSNMSVADSRRNLKTMIDRIHAWASENHKQVEIIVQTMNNIGPACDGSYRDAGPFFQGWAEEAAANHLLLIDHYANWLKLYNSEANHATWKSYVPDELHPNPLGTAKVIVPAIQQALTEQARAASSH
jgi:lysophospholipase L1-like esterase